MTYTISASYGRCIEGWQRTQAAIDFRLSQLASSAATAADLDDDLDLQLLLGDRRDWERLMRDVPVFVESAA